MSISTNIDGSSGGTNQLLDLLSVVSNPAIYEAKIKELQSVTDAYNAAIKLAGPADEIVSMRQKIAEDKKASSAALEYSQEKAQIIIDDANKQAALITSDAQAQANVLIANAESVKKETQAKQADVEKAKADVEKAKADNQTLNTALQLQLDAVNKAWNDAHTAQQEAEALKADIVAKHTAFIKSL